VISSKSAQVNVDAIAPTITSVVVNDGIQKTGSNVVKVQITSTESGGSGLAKYQLSTDNQVWVDYKTSATNYTIDSFTLPQGQGTKDIYVRAVDNAGNVSNTVKSSIFLKDDNEAPKVEIYINNNDPATTSQNVVLTINAYDDLTPINQLQMRFSNDGVNWTAWEPLAFTKNWTLTSGEGIKRYSYK